MVDVFVGVGVDLDGEIYGEKVKGLGIGHIMCKGGLDECTIGKMWISMYLGFLQLYALSLHKMRGSYVVSHWLLGPKADDSPCVC
jgi:hypothetical protein